MLDDGEPVVVPIEDALDLHAFAPRDSGGFGATIAWLHPPSA